MNAAALHYPEWWCRNNNTVLYYYKKEVKQRMCWIDWTKISWKNIDSNNKYFLVRFCNVGSFRIFCNWCPGTFYELYSYIYIVLAYSSMFHVQFLRYDELLFKSTVRLSNLYIFIIFFYEYHDCCYYFYMSKQKREI